MSNLNHVPNDLLLNLQVFKSTLKDAWDSLSDGKKDEITAKCLPPSLSSNEQCTTVDQLLKSQLKHFDTDLLESAFFQLKITKLAPDIGRALEDVRKLNAKANRLKEKENQLLLWTEVINRRRRLFRDSVTGSPYDSISVYDKKKLMKETSHDVNCAKRCDIIPGYIGQMVSRRYNRELKDLRGLVAKKGSVISSDEEDLQSTSTDNLDILFSENVEANAMPLLLKQQKFDPIKCYPSKLTDSGLDSYSEYRYRMLLKQHKRKKKLSDNKSPRICVSNSNDVLQDIIARAKGLSDDSIVLVSPPSLKHRQPVKKLKKLKNVSTDIQPDKEVTSTGLEVMSRKLNLNLECVKKESVFDFIEDLPSESQPIKLPAAAAAATATTSSMPVSVASTVQTVVGNSRIIGTPVAPVVTSVVTPPPAPPPPVPVPAPTSAISPATAVTTTTATTTTSATSATTKCKTAQAAVNYEKPPASFFSLIRDIFRTHAPNDQKLTLHKLEELAKDKLRLINPSVGWNHESVQSAMNFLSYYAEPDASGENVPLVDYKEKNQQWQWIGADRDSDDVLIPMCREWTAEKDRNSSVIDPSQPIPPSICPTQWTVQPSTDDERKAYRDQEAIRYRNPQRAFTYRIHLYESVVGPVKGCGNAAAATPAASPNKAREHSLLVSDRPPFVTLLSLVRDAAARLPNGEGTRADICELLKDSQYLLSSVSDQQINSIVSGALDRLHYEKDPCVKYDVNRKVWIYLHRNRSESDFERLHEMQVAAAKAKRNLSKRSKPTTSSKATNITTPVLTTNSLASPPPTVATKSPVTLHSVGQFKVSTNVTVDATSIASGKDATPIVTNCNSGHKVTATPLAPKTSSHMVQCSSVPDSTDQNILNILNQAQGNAKTLFKQNIVSSSKDTGDTVTIPVSICTSLATSGATISPIVSVPSSSVVSMIPVVSLPQVAKVFNSADNITSSGIMSRLLQNSTQTKSLIKTLPVGSKNIATSNDLKKLTLCQTTATASTNKVKVQTSVQPIVRHVQQNQPQTISIQSSGQQLTVPSSFLMGARSGQVVLATGAGGKSYMMTTAPAPGSIVFQQNTSGGQSTINQATLAQASSGLRVQNIKVISMPSNSPRLIVPQHSGQVVARIITRPSTPGSNNQQNPIVMTPNSGFQPVILTSAALPISSTNVTVQSTPSLSQSTVQTSQLTTTQLTTVPIVISKQQANV